MKSILSFEKRLRLERQENPNKASVKKKSPSNSSARVY
jgi:hypothetical protein